MDKVIDISSIYDKPINFLIGSGASYGLFPTLELSIKIPGEEPSTIETLATKLDETRCNGLFAHYYASCIRPAQIFTPDSILPSDAAKTAVMENYEYFLETILHILKRRSPRDPRCNIFTTNYDGCFQYAAESIMRSGRSEFILNDGTVGFKKKLFQPRAFNSYLCRTGIFERSVSTIPQINLINIHGSVYWSKEAEEVVVDYGKPLNGLASSEILEGIKQFSNDLLNPSKSLEDLPKLTEISDQLADFKKKYDKLPIVNPRKWKFYETVFEEHYYHMLRMLSYELEKPNAVLVVFGFSFADEHILSLVKRSLANTSLKIFVCCFDEKSAESVLKKFLGSPNIEIICDSTPTDFTRFNQEIFHIPDTRSMTSSDAGEETPA